MAQAHKKRGGSRKAKRNAKVGTKTTDTHRWSTARDEGAYRRLENGHVVTKTGPRNVGQGNGTQKK